MRKSYPTTIYRSAHLNVVVGTYCDYPEQLKGIRKRSRTFGCSSIVHIP